MRYLIKLKNLLQYNLFIILFIIITYIYVNWYISINIEFPNDNEFIGIIQNIKVTDDSLELELKGKEKILAKKYFDSENNKEFNDLHLGYKLKVTGIKKIPSSNTNFNLFNYKNYLLSKKINYVMDIENISVLNKEVNVFYKIKNNIISFIDNHDYSNYLYAFLLGNTSKINDNVRQSYLNNGVSHLFSVSGMHVGFVSSILLFSLDKVSKYKKVNSIIVFIILLMYSFLTNFSPSILRSVIFMIILFIKKELKIEYSNIKLFMLMTCIFLLYNPYFIYNSGFLYSFVISGFLIKFNYLFKDKNYFCKLFLISFVAFLSSFPISLYNNFQLNFFSLILNLLFVPLVSMVIFPLSFIVILLPFLTPIYMFLVNILENISLWFSNNMALNIIFGKPTFLLLILYYLIDIVILKNINKKYGYLLLFFVFIINYSYKIFINYPRLTILDVGQGDSILLELPNNNGNILIDTGGGINGDYSLSKNTIIPYLKSVGVAKLDYMVLTHGDFDHLGEAINLVNNFKVEKVIFNCGEFSDLEKELISVLNKKNIKYYSCIKELNIDNNKLYFLNNKDYGNENDNSIVLYTKINNKKFLFMGDASIKTEKDILNNYNLKDIDVLKVGHHGSKTSSSKEFIDYINPKYSVINVGKNNRYAHPNKEVLEVLDKTQIYRTDIDGSVMFKIKNNKLNISTCPP